MDFRWAIATLRCSVAAAFFLAAFPSRAAPKSAEAWAAEPMVDLAKACPTICIELRYASARNITGKPIYPANARCFVRQSVAERLQHAQDELHEKGLALKIWDAYRPAWAQKILWQASPNSRFLQSPSQAASMHTRGVAVDTTLITLDGQEVPMPTDFDSFTSSANMRYTGDDLAIEKRLYALQLAMANAGFLGIHSEWWHFVAKDYANSKPVDLDIQPQPTQPTQPAQPDHDQQLTGK